MTEILVCSLKKFLQPQVCERLDDEGNLSLKGSSELLEADMTKKLDSREVFIGNKCTKIIKGIGLTPSSPQLDWFFNKSTITIALSLPTFKSTSERDYLVLI